MKTRPIQYSQHAYLHPRICAFCGVNNNRNFFVDLGLDIGVHFNAGLEGVIYICSTCLPGTINDLIAIDEAFQGEASVESTYDGLDEFGGRSELPEIPTDAPSGDLSDGDSSSGPVQELDSPTDVRDDSISDSSSEDSGPDDSADESDSLVELSSGASSLVFDLGSRRDS